jgi:adenylate cyclase class 2
METEIEAKFTDIDKDGLRAQLRTRGAVLVHDEIMMRRCNFDYPDRSLDKKGGWIRVRDEGSKITLSYKQLNDRTVHGTQEVSLDVDSFDKSCAFLRAIGLELKATQETKREKWIYKGVDVTIDTWPWVPSFVELEGVSETVLKDVAHDLGLDWGVAMHGSVETVYQMHYDFTEEEIDNWESITFSPPPKWLIVRKK